MSSVNPHVLMNLTSSLRSLSLNDCDLRGKFPENIFHRPNLKLLNLGDNVNLSLSLPQFNQSSCLEFLDLSYMSFSRELFESVGNLVSFEHLNLLGAHISGPIPRALGNLCKLNYLNLRENSLRGQISSCLVRNLTQPEFLYMGDNQLEGSIPDEEVSAFPNLINLDLSSNFLNGMLPSWLCTFSSLESISLFNNQFSGQIKEFQYHRGQTFYAKFGIIFRNSVSTKNLPIDI
ncbi:hypothetical protein PTKIN_Ptkin14bG0025200 [Pterospermum kingtungense]